MDGERRAGDDRRGGTDRRSGGAGDGPQNARETGDRGQGRDRRRNAPTRLDAIVVGAGIAGLVAATDLAAAGLDVVLFEARDRVGGRTASREVAGQSIELGGQWIAPYQTAVRRRLDTLGIGLFPRYRDGAGVYVGRDGRPVRYDGHDAPIGDAASASYAAAVAVLDRLASALDPEAPWDHPRADDLDTISFEEWLRREVVDEDARDLLRFFLAGAFMTKPASSFSLLMGLWTIAGAGGTANLFDPDLVLDARVIGGASAIAQALAAPLGDRVRLSNPVREVGWDARGVTVTAGGETLRARHAVLAVPANLVGSIRFDPPLPGWRMRVDQAFSPGSVIKVQAIYAQPFWREDGLSGVGFGPHEMVREIYDNSPPDGSAGVIVGFLAADGADRASRLPADARRKEVLASFARYVGAGALEPLAFVEHDWSAEEWTRGAYAATFGVGGVTRFGPDMRRPIGPFRFASTDVSGIGHMHMEGAVRSAEAAVAAILAER